MIDAVHSIWVMTRHSLRPLVLVKPRIIPSPVAFCGIEVHLASGWRLDEGVGLDVRLVEILACFGRSIKERHFKRYPACNHESFLRSPFLIAPIHRTHCRLQVLLYFTIQSSLS